MSHSYQMMIRKSRSEAAKKAAANRAARIVNVYRYNPMQSPRIVKHRTTLELARKWIKENRTVNGFSYSINDAETDRVIAAYKRLTKRRTK